MRVLQVGPVPPPIGGVQTNVFSIRDELLRRGHTCNIAAVPRSSIVEPEPFVYHPRGNPFALLRILRRSRSDIVHLHVGGAIGSRAVAIIACVALFSKVPRVLTFHSGGFVISPRGTNPRPFSILGFLFRRFDRVISVNSKMLEMFRKYRVRDCRSLLIYPFSLEVPDPAVSIPDVVSQFAGRFERLIVSVNLLEPEYDIESQVRAMEQLVERRSDTGLIILGGGSEQAALERRIRESTARDHIFLAGEVRRKFVLHILTKADIKIRTTRYDGDAISVREAMFLGCTVIATDTGLRPAGVNLVNVGDSDGLCAAIVEALEQRKHRLDDAKSRTPVASNVNIEKVVALYEELLSRRA